MYSMTEPNEGNDTSQTYCRPKRLRYQKGPRSKYGCQTCKSRHVRCDEAKPSCLRCSKAGRSCNYQPRVYPSDLFGSIAATMVQNESPLALQTYHKFAHVTAPFLGGIWTYEFWIESVLPAATSTDQIFDATLALAKLYEIPFCGNMSSMPPGMQRHYHAALEWYGNSMSTTTIKSGTGADFVSLLLVTVLYIGFELRHVHFQNIQNLTLTAFNLIFNYHHRISAHQRGSILLSTLTMLLEWCNCSTIISAEIPRTHWQCALNLALRTLSEQASNKNPIQEQFWQLKLELCSIVYDISYLITYEGANPSDLNDLDMGDRFFTWHHEFNIVQERQELTPKQRLCLSRLPAMMSLMQHRWHIYQHAPMCVLGLIKELSAKNLKYHYDTIHYFENADNQIPPYTMEGGLLPAFILNVWHTRDPVLLSQIQRILEAKAFDYLPEDFLQDSSEFLTILCNTGYHQATKTEILLFGGRPKISMLWWQAHRLSLFIASGAWRMSQST